MMPTVPQDHSQISATRPAGVRQRRVDVAIVGGGLSGSILAYVLGRAGISAAVIDMHATHPAEFKAEKLAGDQIDMLARLDLLDCLTAGATPVYETVNVRNGRAIDRVRRTEYGIAYQDMANMARARVSGVAEFIVARAADVTAGPDRQVVTLADGGTVESRLLVLATGVGGALSRKLGIERRMIRDGHSLSLGFDVVPGAGATLGRAGLTHYGVRLTDRVDYVSLFPIAGVLRGNLFCHRDVREPWTRAFMTCPREALLDLMPDIGRFLGDFTVAGKVEARVVDLQTVAGHRRDGVVLVGDAFQTTCPATGTGVSKLLTDIEQLGHHIPRWLATPGMGAEKIAQYYDDPAKRACDARALAWSEYRRSVTIDPSLAWEVHRRRVYLHRRMRGLVDKMLYMPSEAAQITSAA